MAVHQTFKTTVGNTVQLLQIPFLVPLAGVVSEFAELAMVNSRRFDSSSKSIALASLGRSPILAVPQARRVHRACLIILA
jgi:hypothetical protein